MDSYLQVMTHPFLWIAAGFIVLFYLVQMLVSWDSSKDDRSRHLRPSPRDMLIRWLKGNYVPTILLTTALLAILALGFYLFDIARAVHNMVGLLLDQTRDIHAGDADLSDSSDTLRNLAQGSALLLGVLAAAATIFFSVIRVWINDRNIRATEDGLITDRINKAVEGLGAEKTSVFRGRFVAWKETEPQAELWLGFVQRWGQQADIRGFLPPQYQSRPENELVELLSFGEWTSVSQTEPNLEVRIGAIFALERIAQDSERDHIQIMEILCAYIRQNAGRENVSMPPADATPSDWKKWARKIPIPPRLDVDMAHKVIRQRSEARKAREEKQKWRLNLQRADLRGLVLEDSNLHRADLRGAKLQGADLRGAKLQRANLWGAELQGADLRGAKLQGANLRDATLQGANLWGAKLQEAVLGRVKLQGADLGRANLQSADLRRAKLISASLRAADLQGANLRDAQLQGAILEHAELQGTDLRGAELQGAYLAGAKLQGADLRDAELQGAVLAGPAFDASTDLSSASFQGALLRSVDFTDLPLITPHLKEAFFDGSVTLPGGITSDMDDWPDDRPREELDEGFSFIYGDESSPLYKAWRAWQREHHPDTLPDHLR